MPQYEVRETPPRYTEPAKPKIRRPDDVFSLCQPMAGYKQEVFRVLLLTAQHHVFRKLTVSKGSLSYSLVHPRDVFRDAIRLNAGAVILVHNHPSGVPEPSRDDIELTHRLHEAGQLLGIEVLDHVVVAKGGCVSLREAGHFKPEGNG